MSEYWKRWWIDSGVFFLTLMALYALVGTQPIWKAIVIGLLFSVSRMTYGWMMEAK